MQPAAAQNERGADIAGAVVATMRQLGIAALPRNYEVFYEALAGTNHDLSLDVVSLPKKPTQAEVDAIGRKYFAHHHGMSIVDNARKIVASELEQIAALLRSEHGHIEKYGQVLQQTSEGLGTRASPSQDLMQKVLGVMTVATKSTIEHGRQTAKTLSDKSAELESVKSKLEEYKKLVDTDPLTGIANRRAFDRELSRTYESAGGAMFKSLILADIDRFKEINDRFGHPVGDKIIKLIAGIFRGNTRSDIFVARTGGEEFAAIADGMNEDGIVECAERVRLAIERTSFATLVGASYGPISVSVGICMASDAGGPDDLYAKADQALYRSKVAGRNRVTRFAAPDAKPAKGWMLYKKD